MTFDPGQLRERVSFQRRAALQDELGNTDTGDFVEQFQRSALYLMRPGSEAVQATRLQGRQPVSIIVRKDSQTTAVAADWQVVDLRDGTVFAIVAPPADMDRTREWLTITAESGVAS